MTQLKKGDQAPSFEAINQNGEKIRLQDFRGTKLVLYFYPKDDTPGCTAEACNLRDHFSDLTKQGFKVLGVSPDNEAKHMKFISKYELPFDLLADTDQAIANAYGVWVEKNMYGRKYMGIARTTFIINEQGVIDTIIDKVKTKDHASQILS